MKLLIGGSPCTHWSIAQTKNRETEPEGLGWELFKNYLIALEKFKPDYFLYENNKSMAPAIRAQITKELGVEPILINSALVSAQNRQRLYWTNIPGVKQPEDRGILLRDILETGLPMREKAYTLKASMCNQNGPSNILRSIATNGHFSANGAAEPVNFTEDGKAKCLRASYFKDGIRNLVGNTIDKKTCVAEPVRVGDMPNAAGEISGSQSGRIYSVDGKGVPLQARPNGGGADGAATGLYAVPADGCQSNLVIEAADGKTYPVYEVKDGLITIKGKQYPIKLADGFYIIRKLTVTECKRLQTVPESYVFPVSDTQAYKMLGNGWTVDVIAHILHYAPGITEKPLEVLSMYDGMSCGRLALNKLGASVVNYYATEIDKYAVQTTQHNFPDTIQLGDAFQVRETGWVVPGQSADDLEREEQREQAVEPDKEPEPAAEPAEPKYTHLEIVPMTLREANAYVDQHHRHHGPTVGHKFAIGLSNGEEIVGVAIVGRPVSRHLDDGWTLEVNRLCTDGTKNACSMLYAAAWRAARAMGYKRIVTYILDTESGTSLRAAGWKCVGQAGGLRWTGKRRPEVDLYPEQMKIRFEQTIST